MNKKKKSSSKGNAVVAIDQDRMKKLQEYKASKGTSIVFFVAQAIDNEFKRLESTPDQKN